VKARYDLRAGWTPAPFAKKLPGTLDGLPYAGTGRYEHWASGIMPRGAAANFSNVGDFNLDIRKWSDTWGFALLDQRSRKERFWKKVDGRFEFDVETHAYTYDIHGTTHHGLKMKQAVSADAKGLLTLRYEVESPTGRGPIPFMAMRFNLPSAMSKRFVGETPQGRVFGYVPDLDRTLRFRHVVDWSVANLRVGMRLSDGVEYRMDGSRDPRRWQGGWSGFIGRIHRPDFGKWAPGKRWVAQVQVQVRDSAAKPWLTTEGAPQVTEDRRFDFSALYKPSSNAIAIVPVGRRVHVYGVDESVALRVEFPKSMRPKVMVYRVLVSQTGKVVLTDEVKLNPD